MNYARKNFFSIALLLFICKGEFTLLMAKLTCL